MTTSGCEAETGVGFRLGPITVLASGLDVAELSAWIQEIPLTEWPPGDLAQLRPAMVTDPQWNGIANRTDELVARLLREAGCLMAGSFVDKHRWLSVVMPGHTIDPHSDAAEPGWVRRVHVPLTTNEKAIVVSGGKRHHLEVGSAYLFDKTTRHSVTNKGATPRIHFMFEIMQRNVQKEN